MTSTDNDDDSRLFSRSIADVPDGGSLVDDLKRALVSPFTMTFSTFVKGGLLVLASLFSLPAPLLYGYAIAAVRRLVGGEPLPDFEEWTQQYTTGVAFVVLLVVVLFCPFFLLALGAALVGAENSGGALASLIVLWWLYSVPWAIGVSGTGSYREFTRRSAWTWLVSGNYLATWLLVVVLLLVGYVVFTVSLVTIVGPLFVTFYLVVMFWVLLGGRYTTHLATVDEETNADLDLWATVRTAIDAVPFEEWTSGSAPDDTGPAVTNETDTDRSSADTEQSNYARLRERATTIDRSGPVERSETDDGFARFLSLAPSARSEASTEAFEMIVARWENLRNAPEVATVIESGDEPTPWVAFDPSDGPLSEVGGDLSSAGVIAVLEDVEEGIATGRIYNVAHGELTPDRIYIERKGGTAPAQERINATVSDWGIERTVREAIGTDDTSSRYLAPEQRDGGPPNRSADVYQIAAVTHYALLGEPPHADVSEEELTDSDERVEWSPPDGYYISEDTAAAFKRALAPDPDERYDGTDDFVRAIRNALE